MAAAITKEGRERAWGALRALRRAVDAEIAAGGDPVSAMWRHGRYCSPRYEGGAFQFWKTLVRRDVRHGRLPNPWGDRTLYNREWEVIKTVQIYAEGGG